MVYILHSRLLDDKELLHIISKGTAPESDKTWSALVPPQKLLLKAQFYIQLVYRAPLFITLKIEI